MVDLVEILTIASTTANIIPEEIASLHWNTFHNDLEVLHLHQIHLTQQYTISTEVMFLTCVMWDQQESKYVRKTKRIKRQWRIVAVWVCRPSISTRGDKEHDSWIKGSVQKAQCQPFEQSARRNTGIHWALEWKKKKTNHNSYNRSQTHRSLLASTGQSWTSDNTRKALCRHGVNSNLTLWITMKCF